MPRLLLVDDNPSIHKIAETLLASSDVQLVSCGSGDQALALVDQGDRFDVALLDTTMAGMDGWTLLRRLREAEPTRRMPVAMMAGVLDVVDPEQVRQAPIQGFLKKPVELRDLAERVRRLLETPVAEPAPAAPEPDLGPGPEAADEVLQLGPEDLAPGEAPAGELEAQDLGAGALDPGVLDLDEEGAADMGSSDLELGDLALEPAEALAGGQPDTVTAPDLPDPAGPESAPLVLEELDLEELRNLEAPVPAAGLAAPQADAPQPPEPFTLPEFLLVDTLPDLPGAARDRITAEALPDLGADLDRSLAGAVPAGAGEPIDWTDQSDDLVGLEPAPSASAAALAPTPRTALPDSLSFADLLDAGPGSLPLPPVPPPPAMAVPPPVQGDGAQDPLAALLANPVLLDRLAKAVVARLGDQALREIAWEVMPELAERLRRQEAP